MVDLPTPRMRPTTPSPDAGVRDARPGDVAAMGQLHSAAWRSAYGELLPPEALADADPDALAQAWQPAVDRPPSADHGVLVATASGEVVGLAAYAPAGETSVGELVALVVSPDQTRHGHGSRLLNAVADRLRERGFEVLVAWSPIADEPRRAFLQSAGFAPDGTRRSWASTAESADDDDTDDNAAEPVLEVRLVAALAGPA